MELNLKNLDKIKKAVDYYPSFDIGNLREKTVEDPKWIAFGSGNIFRAFIAKVGQKLVDEGVFDRGINVVESIDADSIHRVYKPNDNLALSVILKKSGQMESTLIGNIAETLIMNEEFDRLKEIFTNKNLQIISYTITEKGYDIYDSEGQLRSQILEDINKDPRESSHLMVNSVGLLYERYKVGYPVTMLSLDNLSKNGDVLKKAILTIAALYIDKGRYDKGFMDYLTDKKNLSFPWTMIDKITPGPDEKVREYLEEKGFEDLGPYKREKGSPIAKFVNAEEAQYLAIEDDFANGRPDFSKVGVYLVERDLVDKIETMKVTACLNPLHTALAVYGCLLGYNRIYEEMKDKELVALIEGLAYKEAIKVVENPKVIDPEEFVKEVIEIRFPNPFMPDSPQRIATDTSLKIPVRYGKTLKTYKEFNLDTSELTYIPLAIAGWLRYLLGVNDKGEEFDLSPDPNIEQLRVYLEGIRLGNFNNTKGLNELLENTKYFGVSLKEVGIRDKVIGYFEELCQGVGAVRDTLIKYTE